MTAKDYRDFTTRLARDYPDQSFLVLRFGDHQPAHLAEIARARHRPEIAGAAPDDRRSALLLDLLCAGWHQLLTADLSSALETLDAAYIPIVIQEAAGVPLDPSFEEQKKIMLRCKGVFDACKDGAEARRFNRLLIDAGLVRGL